MRGIIQEEWNRIKGSLQGPLILLCLLLVGAVSFGLGRLSGVLEAQNGERVSVELVAQEERLPALSGGLLVGSRRGSKYHFPWCSGASTIAEGNKVWFANEEEARRRGYTPAGNCKGLE